VKVLVIEEVSEISSEVYELLRQRLRSSSPEVWHEVIVSCEPGPADTTGIPPGPERRELCRELRDQARRYLKGNIEGH